MLKEIKKKKIDRIKRWIILKKKKFSLSIGSNFLIEDLYYLYIKLVSIKIITDQRSYPTFRSLNN